MDHIHGSAEACVDFFPFNYCLQLDWSKGKVSPLVSSLRGSWLRHRAMPLNIFQDLDGLSRIRLTEPSGSSVEVIY